MYEQNNCNHPKLGANKNAKSVYAKMYAIISRAAEASAERLINYPNFFWYKSILTHALGKLLGAIKGS